MRRTGELVLLSTSFAGLLAGAALHAAGQPTIGNLVWSAATMVALGPAAWSLVDAFRHRRLGADVIAVLALVGTMAVGEYLAGVLIAVMLASGRALEAWASARARRTMQSLLERAPREAHRVRDQGSETVLPDTVPVETVPVEAVSVGDRLLVASGEVVPVDGVVVSPGAVLDESALTGEAVPVERGRGDPVRSGTQNAGGPFELRTTTTSSTSTYAGIVRLIREAQASSAPLVRLADHYAGAFLLLSLALAAAAWIWSGSATRAVAVLVVATPCPLILAAPVAIVAGMSRAAALGVVVKDGGALEGLARAEVLLLDKTGTLTAGQPSLTDVVAPGPLSADDILRLAGALDQASPHVLAAAIVGGARNRDLTLMLPTDVQEVLGRGIRGMVGDHAVAVGKLSWVSSGPAPAWVRSTRRRAALDALATVWVGVDGELAGAMLLHDPIRPDAARTIRRLRDGGMRRVVVVTGDSQDVGDAVGIVIGADEVLAERAPADKVEAVRFERQHGPTMMVGDGVNDAPALALADVGVAVATRGATASSEAADVLLTVNRLDRLGEACVVARRSQRVARQSVIAGIGMSLVAMVAAAVGWLPPAWGALLQEGIDVAVIVNALRALRTGGIRTVLDDEGNAVAQRFATEHRRLSPSIQRLRDAADALELRPADEALALVRDAHRFLVEDLAPHEAAEAAELYPVVARALGGLDPTAAMERTHAEIAYRIRRLGRLLDGLDAATLTGNDIADLRQSLYGLNAILELHFAQEDEGYLSLASADDPSDGVARHDLGDPPPQPRRSAPRAV